MNLKLASIAFAAVLILLTALAVQESKLQSLQTERDQAISFNNARSDSLKRFTRKDGQEVVRSKVQSLTKDNLKALGNDERVVFAKKFNKKPKQILEINKTEAKVDLGFSISIIPYTPPTQPLNDNIGGYELTIATDTSKYYSIPEEWSYEDKGGWFVVNSKIQSDSLAIGIRMNVPLESIMYWERPHKFLGIKYGRKEWFKETTSPNPYVEISKDQLTIIGKRK